MVVTKNTRRRKKPIETTLGKAPDTPKKNEKDISALRQPIETSVRGAKELAGLLQTGTDEVKDLISYECDLMYECRICRTIFRCLSNFVLHKRKYCLQKFNPACNVNHNETQIVEPTTRISALDKIVERLRVAESKSEASKESLTWNVDDLDDEAIFSQIVLEKIDSNDCGIFQTFVNDTSDNKPNELMKIQVMENYKKLNNDVPVLDPEGKICGYTSDKIYNQSLFPKCNFSCKECTQKFATRKSLNNHVKTIHSPSKLLYFCPACKETLDNPRCVYRHLLRVHNMPFTQVEKMRYQVNNNCKVLRKDEDSIKIKKRAEPTPINNDSEHQWIIDMEVDKDSHMCVGCGTYFERKAALQAHFHMCPKKKEGKMEKTKSNKRPIEEKKVTGALKRKRRNFYSGPRKRIISMENPDEENSAEIEEKLNQLENNNILSSAILNEVTVESATVIENKMQEVLTGSANNNDICDTITIIDSNFSEDEDEVPLSPDVIDLNEIEETEVIIPLDNVESLLLDHSPGQNEVDSILSDLVSGSSKDDSEVILVNDDDVESEPDLLDDGVSFERFYQKIVPDNSNKTSSKEILPEMDDDVILLSEENEIVEEIIDPINLQQDDDKTSNPNEDMQEAEAIEQEQGANDKQKNNMKKQKTRKNIQEADHNIKQKEQADDEQLNEIDRSSSKKTVQLVDVDPLEQDQQISETDEPNIEEQAGTKTTEPANILKKKQILFPECALPYIILQELSCIPCHRKFITEDELHCHMSGHFSWFRFQCTKCSFVSFREEVCIMHAQERHSLEQDDLLRCVVPMPYRRAESIIHSYKPLEDGYVVAGAYIDEEIGEEEVAEPIIANSGKYAEQEWNTFFFNNSCRNTNDEALEKTDAQSDQIEAVIIDDQLLLPEPIEMACPAENNTDIVNNALENEESKSSDDSGLSQVWTARRKTEKKRVIVKKPLPESVPSVRAVRMRTKVKQDDFFYYDSITSLNQFSKDATVPTTSKKKREK